MVLLFISTSTVKHQNFITRATHKDCQSELHQRVEFYKKTIRAQANDLLSNIKHIKNN